MGALEVLLSRSKPKGDDMEEEKGGDPEGDEDKEASLEDEHLNDAFAAVKSGDKEAFVEAMKGFKGC